jgi:hypothetical protein
VRRRKRRRRRKKTCVKESSECVVCGTIAQIGIYGLAGRAREERWSHGRNKEETVDWRRFSTREMVDRHNM